MKLGVVGHEQAKFTELTEKKAREEIYKAIAYFEATELVSGRCPLGGVDIYAEEIAAELGLKMTVFAPLVNEWGAPGGFRERNLKIANHSDIVQNVVVEKLPPGYTGMEFEDCYHCRGRNPLHVKSGGCWTAWKCKDRIWSIIKDD